MGEEERDVAPADAAGGAPARPFTREEMRAMRRAAREAAGEAGADPAGVAARVLARLRRLSRALPFAPDLLAALACARDPATDPRVRLGLLAALAYFALPFDAVPDLLPLVGFADDAAVLAAAVGAVRGAITDAHRAWARDWLAREGAPGAGAPKDGA